VTVGETLAEARTRAGLTVNQVSERTKIREAVIRDIERDDYSACGGDVFVHGYVRVLADAVGIEAQPLIHEYDRSRGAAVPAPMAPAPMAPTAVTPAALAPAADETRLDLPGTNLADTVYDIPPVRLDDTVSDIEPVPAQDWPTGAIPDEPVRAGGGAFPATAAFPIRNRGNRHGSGGYGGDKRAGDKRADNRRKKAGIGVLAVVILAVVAIVGVLVASRLGNGSGSTATGRSSAALNRKAATTSGAAKAKPTPAKSATKPKASASTPAKPAPQTAPAKQLAVPLAEAFGPDGTADGDNPQTAMNAVRSGASLPWTTDWYTTAEFGSLKHGTGMLLDMGSKVTITNVRVNLGSAAGTSLQLLAGTTPSLADLRVVASASNTGGVVDFRLSSPASAQYLVVWFTQLPPVAAGQYQASVYDIAVTGRP